MNRTSKKFIKIFLVIWIIYVSLVGMSALIDMDLDKTKAYWCENGFDNLDCGYSLRWVFCFAILIASVISIFSIFAISENSEDKK